MPSKNHIHKYHRRRLGTSNKVWACALPDCSHYIPKHMESMAEGKQSVCNQCGEEFVLNIEAMESDKPRCENCRLGRTPELETVELSPMLKAYLEGKES